MNNVGVVLAINTRFVALAVALMRFVRPLRKTRVRAVQDPGGYQAASITVKGRYYPEVVEVEQGVPTRLHFIRDEDVECSERVIFAGVGVDRRLLPFQETTIEFVPREQGEFLFTCQRGVYRGTLVVKPPRGGRHPLRRSLTEPAPEEEPEARD